MTTRVGAVGVEETTGTGGLLRSGGRLEAFPMPLGSERTLGLAGPNGTPLIGELPAPADPAGGVSCAKACPGRDKLPSTARISTVIRDTRPSGSFNHKVSRMFSQAIGSASPCVVRCGIKRRKSRIEYKWSGRAQRADLIADMLNRQQLAKGGHRRYPSCALTTLSEPFVGRGGNGRHSKCRDAKGSWPWSPD